MAENKRSFILYADYIHTVKKLPKEKIGELFLTILSYVNDENPVVEDLIVDLVFEPIRQQLKRDLKEWEVIKEDRSNGGKLGNLKRWNKDLYDKVVDGEMKIKDAEKIAKHRKTSVSDKNDRTVSPSIANVAVNVTDNVNVNDNVNDISIYKTEGGMVVNGVVEIKDFPIMPKVEDVGELPTAKINSAIELLKITKQTDATVNDITILWKVFKIQNLTGKRYYSDVEAVHSHFLNWVPLKDIKKIKQENNVSTARKIEDEKAARILGIR